jgi:hypothetical protein
MKGQPVGLPLPKLSLYLHVISIPMGLLAKERRMYSKLLLQNLYLCKAHHKIPKSCITMEDPTIVTLVRTSLVLVMKEVHYKGGFPSDLKG